MLLFHCYRFSLNIKKKWFLVNKQEWPFIIYVLHCMNKYFANKRSPKQGGGIYISPATFIILMRIGKIRETESISDNDNDNDN